MVVQYIERLNNQRKVAGYLELVEKLKLNYHLKTRVKAVKEGKNQEEEKSKEEN